ncbi:glutathione S-transferase family protein [Roseibium aggregatum]|uniref:Glutathione S-transferase family protein n=1 Tax=Roseibium aggregatum TaxID=187304 RepID=A0A926S7R6_9HYPH|nr:glutathione S-transferase family protein [Roseibium aggregatum]MBD1548590.1 glutathione S-transferase family protein [Roseibium aggregatum]
MLILYHGATSVCSQKVRLGLAELGLAYEGHLLDLMTGDQFDPDYLKLNPNAVVPTLVDDGMVVIESSLILEYLDETYNAGGLMPADPDLKAKTKLWLLRCLAIHGAINSLSFATVNRAKQMAGKTPEQLETMLRKIPDPISREKRRDLLDNGVASIHVEAALREMRSAFADMKVTLERYDWVSGPGYGLADIALLAYIDRLDRLAMNGLWEDEFPEVSGWLERSKKRDSYRTAIASFLDPSAAENMYRTAVTFWPAISRTWSDIRNGPG